MGGERTYVTPGFIAAMVVLGASGVVIILVAAIFVSWCIWKYFRHLREPSAGLVQMRNRVRESEVNRAMENGGVGRGIHRVVSVGVPPGFILTLPLVNYSKNGAHLLSIDAKGHMSECPVCLTEYRDGERVRLLPNCKHIFHPKCINTWLESHTTCPLCRTGVQLLRKGKSVSSVDRILSMIRRSGSGRGAHVVDSSGRDRYSTSLQPVTVVTPPPQLSTGGQLSPFTREPFSRPVSREIHVAHIEPDSRELPRGQSSDASIRPSSTAREAGMIFSSVWGPYVDSQTSGTSCSSSSGVGSSQVLVATMPSSEDASTSATEFVTISLDPEQPER